MSGGVDSSVAAAQLVEQGHEVTGVTLQLLPEGQRDDTCCSADAIQAASRVCERLDIPHHTLNMRDVFERQVIAPFVDSYAAGLTPNPCIECNMKIKFGELLAKARAHEAEYLATGHYARVFVGPDEELWLARGKDTAKDQSYFLYRLVPELLRHVMFPLGNLSKDEVRAEASRLRLPSATRPESQEVCFIPSDVGSFVEARAPASGRAGPIVDADGQPLGTHRGIVHYTVGQRKGLGLSGGPWYIAEIRPERDTLVVTSDRPRGAVRIVAGNPVWRGGEREVSAMVRYRAKPVPARVVPEPDQLTVHFAELVDGVAPGQAVVCYDEDRVVGGGVVMEAKSC